MERATFDAPPLSPFYIYIYSVVLKLIDYEWSTRATFRVAIKILRVGVTRASIPLSLSLSVHPSLFLSSRDPRQAAHLYSSLNVRLLPLLPNFPFFSSGFYIYIYIYALNRHRYLFIYGRGAMMVSKYLIIYYNYKLSKSLSYFLYRYSVSSVGKCVRSHWKMYFRYN